MAHFQLLPKDIKETCQDLRLPLQCAVTLLLKSARTRAKTLLAKSVHFRGCADIPLQLRPSNENLLCMHEVLFVQHFQKTLDSKSHDNKTKHAQP